MAKKAKFNFFGILILIAVVMLVSFLVVMVYSYQNLKTVEHNVHNLYNQVRTQNSKIEKISTGDDGLAQQSKQFSEATRNWQTYQNSEFNFQLKSPVSWGDFGAYVYTSDEINYLGSRLEGNFDKFNPGYLDILVETYDFFDVERSDLKSYANEDVKDLLFSSEVGECGHQLFEGLKSLDLGEVRNCYVRENILKQKFIVFRSVQVEEELFENILVSVYPREDYYVMARLPNEILDEVEFFIQSVIFMN